MKTINNNESNFPRPFKFAIYLIAVFIVGLMNWMVSYANDSEMEDVANIETRLAEALVPLPDPEPELEDWILSLSENMISQSDPSVLSLESRLAEALEPVEESVPGLEGWLLNLSDDILSEDCE
jgi:hypothetical protein